MKFIEWSEAMSVGSDELDGHHQMIIDCLNRLHPLLNGKSSPDEVRSVLATLEDFVLVHFSEEEQTMRRVGYPGWRAHKELHDRMYDIVFNMKADVEHGRTIEAEHLFELIYDWLQKHILGEDRKYEPYLANPQPSQAWTRSNGKPY